MKSPHYTNCCSFFNILQMISPFFVFSPSKQRIFIHRYHINMSRLFYYSLQVKLIVEELAKFSFLRELINHLNLYLLIMRKDLEFSEDLKRIEAGSDNNLRALCFKLANQPIRFNFTQFLFAWIKSSYFSSCSVKTNLDWDVSSVVVLSKESWFNMST